MEMGHQVLQQLVNGVSLGSIYALIALGYTMIYGIIKLINFAHGDIYMVGAYIGFFAITQAGLSIVPALLVSLVTTALLGMLVEKLAYKPLRHAPRLSVLITAIGVSFFLEYASMYFVSPTPRTFPAVMDSVAFSIGGLVINGQQMMDQIIATPEDSDELHLVLDYTEEIDSTKETMQIDVEAPDFQEFEGTSSTPDQLAFIRQVKLTLAKRGVIFDPTLGNPPSAMKANRLMAALKEIVIRTMDLPAGISWVINGQQVMDQIIGTPDDAEGIHLTIDYYVTEHEVTESDGMVDSWAMSNAAHIAQSAIDDSNH